MESAAMPGYSLKADEVEYTSLYLSAKKSQSLFLVELFCYFCVHWQAAPNILFPLLNSVWVANINIATTWKETWGQCQEEGVQGQVQGSSLSHRDV